jgi:phosphate transport system substrate-binding protein
MNRADRLIQDLRLEEHPKGGWYMRLLLPCLATLACAAAEGIPETERLNAAIAELAASPPAAAYRALSRRINDLQDGIKPQIKALRSEQEQLEETPAFQAYERRRAELDRQRLSGWDLERQQMQEAAKRIYAARHDELRGLSAAALPQGVALGFDVLTYPRIDGSTSTSPLGLVLACRLLDVPYRWLYPELKGRPWRTSDLESRYELERRIPDWGSKDAELELVEMRPMATPEGRRNERLAPLINSRLAKHSSTHAGWLALIEGRCDLNLTARAPSASELQLAKEKGVTLRSEAVARDAFVMLVHVANPVRSLTRAQVRGIYEDRFTAWAQVGGGEGTISAYRRQRDSGSRELFDQLVLEGGPSPDLERHRDLYGSIMGHPYSELTMNRRGIGYSIWYYERFMAGSPYTRPLAIDGIEPTTANIASGAYPWSTQVYLAWREGEAEDGPAMRLKRWLLSSEGQAVVRESGYVPVR